MHRYWPTLMRRVCDFVQPRNIVEIGAAAGINSRNVLDYCDEVGAHVDIIDPVPFQPEPSTAEKIARVATFHEITSHDALPKLTGDVYFVDGDHNWFTVYHDMRLIEEANLAAGHPMPVIFAHDVSWPYGRRDMYYAADRIPAEHRQPFARRGILPGRSELLAEGGFNRLHDNALTEGGPKNGVLTGIDDFLAESKVGWEMYTFPSFHGLAVLIDPAAHDDALLGKLRELLTLTPSAREQLQAVEDERIQVILELMETYRRLGGRPGPRAAKVLRLLKRVLGK